jgi:hypothetical protein
MPRPRPNVEWWDRFLLDHLQGLRVEEIEEYDAIGDWIVMLSDKSTGDEDAHARLSDD